MTTKQTIKITPRGKWVLVKPIDEKNSVNDFGLIVPSSVEQEQKAQGTVVSAGKLVEDIKKGDQVVYGAYAGEPIKIKEGTKEVEYKLLLDEDIIAFIEK